MRMNNPHFFILKFLPVPLITEIIDLIRQSGQIFIGSALVMLDNNHKPSSRSHKPFKYGTCLSGRCLLRLTYRHSFYHTAIIRQIIAGTAVRCHRIITIFISQTLRKNIAHSIFTMHNKYPLRLLFKSLKPADQSLFIRMAADSSQLFNMGKDFNRLTEKLHFLSPFHKSTSQSAIGLIADK